MVLGEGHGDAVRATVECMVQLVMVLEVGKLAGAGLHERTDERRNHRNGYRDRALDNAYPYLWLDATVEKVREGKRVVSRAVVVANGVNDEGYREVLGLEVGAAESRERPSRRRIGGRSGLPIRSSD